MKKFIPICGISVLLVLTNSTIANTTASSTMWFEGDLIYHADTGVYTAIGASEGYYYAPGDPGTTYNPSDDKYYTPDGREAVGGFDVFAKDGAIAYLDLNNDGDFLDEGEAQTIVNHDGWRSPGTWGEWYDPDVRDWENYHLELTDTTWRVWAFNDTKSGGVYETPLEGIMDWTNMIAYETGANWNPHWTWGEENVPLQYSAFRVDISGGECEVSLTPIIPVPGAILLGSIGVALVGWLRRRRAL